MGIEHKWVDFPDDSSTKIIIFDYIDKWTWEEFHQLHKDILNQIEAQKWTMYPIINLGKNTYLPPSALTNLRKNALMTHVQVPQVTLVIDNMFIRTIASMVSRLVKFKNQPRFYNNLPDAQAWVVQVIRSSLVKAS